MTRFFTLILLLFSISSHGQTYSDLIKDSEIENFMKWESENTRVTAIPVRIPHFKMVYYKPEPWRYEFVIPDSILQIVDGKSYNPNIFLNKTRYDLDTIFTKEDIKFIQLQFLGHRTNNKWKAKLFKTFYKRCLFGKTRTYFYSIPVFTMDKQYVIFNKYYYCGSLCAEGELIIYKRTSDNKWTEYLVLSSWIS